MSELVKPEFTKHWIASSDGVQHYGSVHTDQVVTTGQIVFQHFDTKEAWLAELDKAFFPTLPAAGAELFKGDLYTWNDDIVEVRRDHIRTEHDPDQVPALFFRIGNGIDWIEGEKITRGEHRDYEGNTYECIQSHTTQVGWEPSNVPALWSIVNFSTEWVAGEKVSIGDERTYNSTLYRCLQPHTTQVGWEPPRVPALWEAIE